MRLRLLRLRRTPARGGAAPKARWRWRRRRARTCGRALWRGRVPWLVRYGEGDGRGLHEPARPALPRGQDGHALHAHVRRARRGLRGRLAPVVPCGVLRVLVGEDRRARRRGLRLLPAALQDAQGRGGKDDEVHPRLLQHAHGPWIGNTYLDRIVRDFSLNSTGLM